MTKYVTAFTEYGLVKGVKKTTVLDCEYNAFLGIPYAKPPVGDLRFKVRWNVESGDKITQQFLLIGSCRARSMERSL